MANLLNSQLQSVFTIECQNNCSYIRTSASIISDIIVSDPGVNIVSDPGFNKLLKALKSGSTRCRQSTNETAKGMC